jgi:lysine-specific demethylase 8
MHETNFWMSNGGTRSVIHYDADENLHCIINGSKDFLMIENKFKEQLPMFAKV